jgi:hypothetical protein
VSRDNRRKMRIFERTTRVDMMKVLVMGGDALNVGED